MQEVKSLFLFTGLRTPEEREEYLHNIPSAYNFRLQAPLKNITTQEETEEMFSDETICTNCASPIICQDRKHRKVEDY